MKYSNNLTEEWGNAYFRVTEPFDCYLLVGVSESNTYTGRSMVFGNVYQRVTLRPGDEIHDLFGGVFVARQRGAALPARMKLPTKHPFERGPDEPGAWPLAKLERVAVGRQVQYASKPKKMPKGAMCANDHDSVVP